MKLLNIGCGATYHPAWVNIDIEPLTKQIARHDAATPLPFADGSFDACYCSHLLEHLSRSEAQLLLSEMHRVLKARGIVRLVVPDLERIVRSYLCILEQVTISTESAELSYDWIMLELIDQMVRVTSEGYMGPFLKECPSEVHEFIISRIGKDAAHYWDNSEQQRGLIARLTKQSPAWFIDKVRFALVCSIAWLLAGKRGVKSLREGWFRTSGEVHRWMYDQFSLGRILQKAEFTEVVICSPDVSNIPNFANYELDVVNGNPRKPDSLFMEGVRS